MFAADCKCGNDEDEICFSIPCESDDPVCGEEGCIPFRRSRPTIRGDCRPGARAHENTITSFVDASNVYGSFQEDMDDLRDVEKGIWLFAVNIQICLITLKYFQKIYCHNSPMCIEFLPYWD